MVRAGAAGCAHAARATRRAARRRAAQRRAAPRPPQDGDAFPLLCRSLLCTLHAGPCAIILSYNSFRPSGGQAAASVVARWHGSVVRGAAHAPSAAGKRRGRRSAWGGRPRKGARVCGCVSRWCVSGCRSQGRRRVGRRLPTRPANLARSVRPLAVKPGEAAHLEQVVVRLLLDFAAPVPGGREAAVDARTCVEKVVGTGAVERVPEGGGGLGVGCWGGTAIGRNALARPWPSGGEGCQGARVRASKHPPPPDPTNTGLKKSARMAVAAAGLDPKTAST